MQRGVSQKRARKRERARVRKTRRGDTPRIFVRTCKRAIENAKHVKRLRKGEKERNTREKRVTGAEREIHPEREGEGKAEKRLRIRREQLWPTAQRRLLRT